MMDKNGNPSENFSESYQYVKESHWIKAIRNGNKRAFRAVFEAYYQPLLRFAFRYVNSETIAEGLIQEVFLWIWENREEWNVKGKLKTYLFRAVKYKAIDYWRHERTRSQYLEQFSEIRELSTEPISIELNESEKSKFIQAVQQAIEELPERARMVYKLSRLEGLTYTEIADVLEISPKTVETHMSRSLDFLRKRLAKYLPILSVFNLY